MKIDKTMSRIIDGKRYTVRTSTILADNAYWDGSNFERHGRNTYLLKTRAGAFFQVDMTQWEGERNRLTPLTREEAIALYEELDDKDAVPFEEAFDAVVEEASAGRPTMYDQPMRQTSVWMTEAQIAWLKSNGMGETLRRLVDQAMQAEADAEPKVDQS